MRKKTIIAAIFLIIFSLIVYFLALKFPLRAATIPKLMVYIILTCSLLILIKNIYLKKKDDEEPFADINWKKWFISIGLWLVYIWLIPRISFWIATVFFVVAITSYLEMDELSLKKFKLPLFFGIIFTACCYLVFEIFFGMNMP
ncbi:MAG: tripartite tricarboxylate transporter TctB family protein [Peptococcaceae bacterium]